MFIFCRVEAAATIGMPVGRRSAPAIGLSGGSLRRQLAHDEVLDARSIRAASNFNVEHNSRRCSDYG